MTERLTFTLLLSLMVCFVLCSSPNTGDDGEDYDAELRGYPEYETWKPSAQSSAPEVILIKQKDPHHHDSLSSISSIIKHNLPLLAVLAPLVAVSVLLPLKAYLGPAYVVYPPVTAAPPAAPPSARDRVGKSENEIEETSLTAQVLNMIEEMDKLYGEMTTKDKNT